MNKYNNSCIYKIFSENHDELYIGATCYFTIRKSRHKHNCNKDNSERHNLKVYDFIRNNGNWNNWKMEVIEVCNVENKQQLSEIERRYYYNYNKELLLNTYRP